LEQLFANTLTTSTAATKARSFFLLPTRFIRVFVGFTETAHHASRRCLRGLGL
jgi:hypothetical protein